MLMDIGRYWQIYLFLLPALIYVVIFHYVPMYGVQIAFKNYNPFKGMLASEWAGMKYFHQFFESYYFKTIIINTVRISLMAIVFSFPFPIIFALLLNELRSLRFKRFVQTVTYAPHFISTVVMCGMLTLFLAPNSGLLNQLIAFLGGKKRAFLESSTLFPWIYVLSGIWQNLGWNSILYVSTLSSVDPTLYEAARIDGASRFQKMLHVDFPALLPIIVILTILNFGQIMSVGFEKALLLQNNLNSETSELISTYVYKRGLQEAQFSFSTAVGLFNSVVNFTLLLIVNSISRKVSSTSLF
ncbi:MAG: sugar ABC transporter permease [Clostridia bacterium]|nr:sugar ABC transporter permease [Clostridia bacterium]